MREYNELRPGSFNGVPFFVFSATTRGGRKQVKHEFVKSDKQEIEDLGFRPKTYSITCATTGPDYAANKQRLITELDKPGVGVLSHPWFSSDLNVKALPYTVEESMTELGKCRFSLSFEPSESQLNPQPGSVSLSIIDSFYTSVVESIKEQISNNFLAESAYNVQDAANSTSEFFLDVKEKAKRVQGITKEVDKFNEMIENYQGNIIGLVQNPSALSIAITNTITGTRALYASAGDALRVAKSLFGFGELLPPVIGNGQNDIQRRENRRLIVNAARAGYLAQAYQAASEREYFSETALNQTKKDLEKQFDSIIDLDTPTFKRLQETRVSTNIFLDQSKAINVKRIIELAFQSHPLRSIQYQTYGKVEDEVTDELIGLNGLYEKPDISFVSGSIKLLSA